MSGLTGQPWRQLEPAFVDRVLEKLQVDDMVDEVADEVSAVLRDSWSHVDEATFTNLRLTAFAGMSEFLQEAGRPGTFSDRQTFRTDGRAQHQAGRTIEEMLALYELVGIGLWRRTSRAMEDTGASAREFSEATVAFFAYMSELASSAANGYVAAGNEAARGSQTRRDRLMEVLLEDPPADGTVITTAARAASWNAPLTLSVVVTDAQLDEGLLETLPHDVLAARAADHTVMAIPGDAKPRLLDRVMASMGTSLGGQGPVVDRESIRDSYQSARALLNLAHRRGDHPGTMLRLAGNEVDLMVLRDERLAAILADAALRPFAKVPEARREALIATLSAWLVQPDQPLAIAQAMNLHVQTIRYRVRQLREVLGDAIDNPQERARLLLAVRAHALLRALEQ